MKFLLRFKLCKFVEEIVEKYLNFNTFLNQFWISKSWIKNILISIVVNYQKSIKSWGSFTTSCTHCQEILKIKKIFPDGSQRMKVEKCDTTQAWIWRGIVWPVARYTLGYIQEITNNRSLVPNFSLFSCRVSSKNGYHNYYARGQGAKFFVWTQKLDFLELFLRYPNTFKAKPPLGYVPADNIPLYHFSTINIRLCNIE